MIYFYLACLAHDFFQPMDSYFSSISSHYFCEKYIFFYFLSFFSYIPHFLNPGSLPQEGGILGTGPPEVPSLPILKFRKLCQGPYERQPGSEVSYPPRQQRKQIQNGVSIDSSVAEQRMLVKNGHFIHSVALPWPYFKEKNPCLCPGCLQTCSEQ